MPPLVRTDLHERFIFNTREQVPDEPLEDFLDSLRQLSKNCKYEKDGASQNHVKLLIRDRFISGIRSKSVQNKLLQYQSSCLPIEKAIELARKYEKTTPQNNSLKSTQDSTTPTNPQCIKIESIDNHIHVKKEVERMAVPPSDVLHAGGNIDTLSLECTTDQKDLFLPPTFQTSSDDFENVHQHDLFQFEIEGEITKIT